MKPVVDGLEREWKTGNTAKVTLGKHKIMYSLARTLVNLSFHGTLQVRVARHSQ